MPGPGTGASGTSGAYAEDVLRASAAATASGNTAAISDFGPASALVLQLVVSAASGTTPTLNVFVEDSIDGGATWNQVAAFGQKTAVASEVIRVADTVPFGRLLRVRWAIAGTTPSFTFEVRAASQSPST